MYLPNFPMPAGFVWQYVFIRWLQSFATPELDKLATWLSTLGVEAFYMLALPVFFWSINKRIGLRLTYVFLSSMYVNSWLKDFIHVVRPVGVPGIRSGYVSSATTAYSMPSGHAQGPMTFWGILASWGKKVWIWVLVIVLVLLMGISRVYLGLHWPMDVVIGWGLGLLFGIFGWLIGRWWTYRAYAFPIRMTLALLVPAVLWLIHNGPASGEYAGYLLGMGGGAVLEHQYLTVDIDTVWWKRPCTAVIGIAGLIALQWLIKWPQGSNVLLAVRDVLIGLWGTLGAPYVFYKCGLYRRGETSD